VRHADDLVDADRADLLERWSTEARATDRMDAALEAATRAVTLRRRLGDRRSLGLSLGLQARALWNGGQSVRAAEVNHEAIRILEEREPGEELADAYAGAASYAMLARDHAAAIRWGDKAITLAERLGATRVLAHALNSVGSSKLVNGRPDGADDLRQSIAVATEGGHEDLVALGWVNLGSGAGEVRDYGTAEPALRQAAACAAQRDLDVHAHYVTAWLARVRLERGDWTEAADLVAVLPLDGAAISPATTIVALGVRGRLHTRRGDADPRPDLDRAWTLATETADLQRLWPIAAARAEAAWLAGDPAAIPGLVDDVYARACEIGHAWAIGELGFWHHRAGSGDALPDGAADPYTLHVAGRHAEAAARWQALGCPYEAADALADSDDVGLLRKALEALDRLEAAAAAARVRRRLRTLGERHIPRGPRPATAASPAGLTPRQTEVLELVTRGLSDADIAVRLHLSPKTVGHHVSAILAKLGAGSRGEAAHLARALGLSDEDGETVPPS
jgi:DNA-binding CsgD family transcriptional regulator